MSLLFAKYFSSFLLEKLAKNAAANAFILLSCFNLA